MFCKRCGKAGKASAPVCGRGGRRAGFPEPSRERKAMEWRGCPMERFRLADLVDVERLQRMIDSLYDAGGISVTILDGDREILVASGGPDACLRYHHGNPETHRRCRRSDAAAEKFLAEASLPDGRVKRRYKCENGLWNVAVPLVVREMHLGTLFLGKFLLAEEEPDMEFFRRQAAAFGFPEKEYLEAIEAVPRFSSERLDAMLRYYMDLVATLVDLSLARIEATEVSEALRESEERYRDLFDTLDQGVVYQNASGEIVAANAASQRILGLSLAQLQGRTSMDSRWSAVRKDGLPFPGEEHPAMVALRTGRAVRNVLMGVFNPQEEAFRWIDVSAHPRTRPGATEPFEVYTTFMDVTERWKALEAVKEKTEEAEQFFLSALDLLCIADTEGRFLRLNAEWEHTLGYSLDDLMGRFFIEFVHPEDVQATLDVISTLGNQKEVLNFINRYRCKDGSYRWIEWRSFPAGRRIYAAARDVTVRREMEEALRESRDRYRLLFERMLDGFALHEILLDGEGKPRNYRFLEVNPAFERLTGLRGEDIQGRTVLDVLPGTEPHWIEAYGRVALSGETLQFRNYARALGRWFEVSAFSPRHGHFATIFTDVTEQERGREERERLIAELERKNEELERFTYTVSHDLKSPLITVKGFLGLLEQDLAAAKPDLVRKDMERIGEAADRMALLLDDLLELSRVGRVVNPSALHSVEELVHRALEAVSGRLAERDVVVAVLPGLGDVYGDGPRLVEVFQNLLENAAKYMGEQENPRIEIGVMRREDGIVYYVADNGIGIEPRYRETIFGLFNKLDPRSEGTGIGLALAQRIVEVHGGQIWVESEGKGKGSVFCLRFPSAPRIGGDDV